MVGHVSGDCLIEVCYLGDDPGGGFGLSVPIQTHCDSDELIYIDWMVGRELELLSHHFMDSLCDFAQQESRLHPPAI